MNPTTKFFLILGLALSLYAPSNQAICGSPQPRLVCAEYFASPAVVEATLTKVTTLHDPHDPDGIAAHVYTLSVKKILRGRLARTFQVRDENDSGRSTFDWKSGSVCLLFLRSSPQSKTWHIDGCGNSGPLLAAQNVLQQIASLRVTQAFGTIHGVLNQQELSDPIAAVLIEARGSHGVFTVKSDENGNFQLTVPAGHYSVRVVAPEFHSRAADFSYENPNQLNIHSGGCAQIAFTAAPSQ